MGFLKTLNNSTGNTNLPLLRVPTPADIIGSTALKHWYSADKLVTADGSNRVSALGDQTANAANVVQGTYGSQPLLQASAQNSKPAIYNDSWNTTFRNLATAAAASASQFEWTSPFSLGVAFVAGAVNQNYEFLIGNYAPQANGLRGYFLTFANANPQLYIADTFGSIALSKTDTAQLVPGTAYTFIFTYDGTGSAAGISLYKNGALNAAATGNATQFTGSNSIVSANQRIRVFGEQSLNSAPHKLLEAVICGGALTAVQVTALDNYFNKKYAIHA